MYQRVYSLPAAKVAPQAPTHHPQIDQNPAIFAATRTAFPLTRPLLLQQEVSCSPKTAALQPHP